MKNFKIIETLMEEILKEEINYVALEKRLYDFRIFLLDITQLDLNDFEESVSMHGSSTYGKYLKSILDRNQ